MRKTLYFLFFYVIFCLSAIAQKIDADSLLVEMTRQINPENNYTKAIEIGKKGIKIAPEYLDFHIALGRAYKITKETDSARYYFNYVIEKNPKYKEAFNYLTQLEIEENKINAALIAVNKGLELYPDDKELQLLKLKALDLSKDKKNTIDYLTILIKKYPKDNGLKNQLFDLKIASYGDRIGINNNTTFFNRDGVGPWNLSGLQYIKQLKNATLIGRYNYIDRQSNNKSIGNGVQYEIESYIKTSKKNYSYAGIGYSDDNIFPKLRLSYSFFQNLSKAWEGDIGIRYNKTSIDENYAAGFGIGKYIGMGWFNLKTYIQLGQKPYPTISSTYRYYFKTQFDYFSINAGYGTSPDEREVISQFEERISLNSYRMGIGYNKVFLKNFILGLQTGFNRQEYTPDKFQTELNISLSLQYKL
ncbi:MAG: YaiO family outer membrane beta-barrel protein [Bacteroidota bacterium]